MKVGILTFNSAHNYGGVLQAYALQTHLESLGLEVEIINYRKPAIDRVYDPYRAKGSRFALLRKYRKLKKIREVKRNHAWKVEKYETFENFINNTLNVTEPYTTTRQLQKANLDHDVLIAGSDQIWNTDLTKDFDAAYFLEFGRKDARRISYAASIGNDHIEEKFQVFFKRYLNNLDFISCREESMKAILGPFTERPLHRTIDPTLLLGKEDYDKLKIDSQYKGQDYIYVHFIGSDDRLIKVAEEMSARLNLPIIHNRTEGFFSNELAYLYRESPERLLSIVDNARYIVTNSFHLTVFALIYERDFVTIPHTCRPGRMNQLLGLVGLENHLIADVNHLPPLDTLEIDYGPVKEKLAEQSAQSKEFIRMALSSELPNRRLENYFYSSNEFTCYGCSLCQDVCKYKALAMSEDKEGYLYPVVDKEKCTDCKACRHKCIFRSNKWNESDEAFPQVYAAVNRNQAVLNASTSAGMFTPLYEEIVARGGSVVGVRYNDDMEVEYAIAETSEACEAFRRSKYVQASIGTIRLQVKELLQEAKPVLFSGNPCQVAALNKYLARDYENLFTVNIICKGVSSPKLFREYIAYLEKKYDSKVVDFTFRDKEKGYAHDKAQVRVDLADGRTLYEPFLYNNFTRMYHNSISEKPSCHNCEFAGSDTVADITIGDYWGIQDVMPDFYKVNTKGISVIMANNQKGASLLSSIKEKIDCRESNIDDVYRANHDFPILLKQRRYQLMGLVDEVDIDDLLRKFNQYKNKRDSDPKIRESSL